MSKPKYTEEQVTKLLAASSPEEIESLKAEFNAPTTSIHVKKCTNCDESKPLSEFYSHANHTADGKDYYCKICRNEQHKLSKKKKKWANAIEYWQVLSSNPFFAQLNQSIRGLSDFKNNVDPVPIATYLHLAPIQRNYWRLYEAAFNDLFAYPFVGQPRIPHHRYFPRNLITDSQATNVISGTLGYKHPAALHIDGRPIGMKHLDNFYEEIKPLFRFYTFRKKCASCKQTKFTYRPLINSPSSSSSSSPPKLSDYPPILYTTIVETKIRELIEPYDFIPSYQTTDGWKRYCRQCQEKRRPQIKTKSPFQSESDSSNNSPLASTGEEIANLPPLDD